MTNLPQDPSKFPLNNLKKADSQGLGSPAVLWSRRRLLKELGKAHGAMAGLLVLPTAWSKPLMEFAAVGALGTLSAAPSTQPSGSTGTGSTNTVPSCMTNAVALAFPANTTSSSVSFSVYWWGASGTMSTKDINAIYNRSSKTLQFTGIVGAAVMLTGSTLGTVSQGGLQVALPTAKFTLQFTTTAADRTYNGQASETISLDFVFAPDPSGSLSISNPKSSHC